MARSNKSQVDIELLREQLAQLTNENQRLKSLIVEILEMLGQRL